MRRIRGLGGRLVATLALALIFVLLLAGCIAIPVGDDSPSVRELLMPKGADAPRPSTVATSLAASGTTSPAMVGTWLSAGSWRVIVARVRTSAKGPGGAKAGKGKSFLLIDIEFKNRRMSETLVVNPKDFTLRNTSGKTIAASDTTSGYNGSGMREIGPGYGGGTVFAYRIPKGSAGYTLTFSPKVAGKRTKLRWGVP